MNGPSALRVIAALTADTFRQARAAWIFWLMLGVSLLLTVLCASVGVVGSKALREPGEYGDFLPRNEKSVAPAKAAAHGVDIVTGDLTVGFGALRVPLGRDARDAVQFIQLLLAGIIADVAGVLLALTWTSAFLPAFLEPGAVAVLLGKPVSRPLLLGGKYLGVLAFVAFQATVFVLATWLALGLKTGIWDADYLWCIPLLLLHFGVFYSFSVLLAVGTGSPVVCVLGSILFWFIAWGMNFGRHALVAAPTISPESTYSPALAWIVEAGYWLLPKPADLGILLANALGAERHFGEFQTLHIIREGHQFHPLLSVLASVLFALVTFGIAAKEFNDTDY